MKYRKKPVEIEAVQLTWDNWGEICDFVQLPWGLKECMAAIRTKALNLILEKK